MDDTRLQPLVDLAERLAEAAAPVSLSYFRSGVGVETKSDESPVTIADREAEAAMRRIIEAECPDHGIVGEEHGAVREDADFVWVLDPIDGTQSFATGKPLFGTLIALLYEGEPIVGVMDMPALRERWVGARGRPTLFDGTPSQTRGCRSLADAWLYATSPQMFEGDHFDRFETLRQTCYRAVYGAECHAYGLLANGWVDVVCEDTMQPYDYAALVPIVEGAGGVMGDWKGERLSMTSDGTVLAVGDPALLDAAVAALAD